jgi:hypothetical protein
MGIGKKLLKTAAVTTATRVGTRVAREQGENLTRAAGWAMNRVRPQRKRNTLARTAAKGLGAAAVAIPLGFWLGRRSRGTEQPQEFSA